MSESAREIGKKLVQLTAAYGSPLQDIIKSIGGNWQGERSDVLEAEDIQRLKHAQSVMRDIGDKLQQHPLERLAHAADDEETGRLRREYYRERVVEVFDSWNSAGSRLCRNGNVADLIYGAIYLLEQADIEIGPVLEGIQNRSYRNSGPIWICHRCEGQGTLIGDNCNLCFGHGFIPAEEDPMKDSDEEVEGGLSLEGRRAINAGEEWTLQQEVETWGYASWEEMVADGNCYDVPSHFRQKDEAA